MSNEIVEALSGEVITHDEAIEVSDTMPWDILEWESEEEYSLFWKYLEQLGHRSLTKLSKETGVGLRRIRELSRANKWTKRAITHDKFIRSTHAERMAFRREQEEMRRLDSLAKARSELLGGIEAAKLSEMQPEEAREVLSDVAEAFVEVAQLELIPITRDGQAASAEPTPSAAPVFGAAQRAIAQAHKGNDDAEPAGN